MLVHLVDGTYELFRHFYAVPPEKNADGMEVAAIQGVLGSMLYLLGDGATHLAVATDHVIESFRNDLWPGYKTGAGIDPALLAQFHPLEQALSAMGVVVFPMVEFEADDALAAAAAVAAADPRVARVLICTPDKDLAQCVFGERVVQFDRRARQIRDEAGVVKKFGVPPASIPDYLALVGDSADGYPGLPGWGAKSAAAVLAATATSTRSRPRLAVGRHRPRRLRAGGDARRAARSGAAVPHAGHAAARRADGRRHRRAPLARPGAGVRGDRRAGSASPACSRGRRPSPRACHPPDSERARSSLRATCHYGSLVASAFVPAAQMMPLAFAYIARSTTTWAGVAPCDSISAP